MNQDQFEKHDFSDNNLERHNKDSVMDFYRAEEDSKQQLDKTNDQLTLHDILTQNKKPQKVDMRNIFQQVMQNLETENYKSDRF